MTPDEIYREFAGAEGVPERALAAAVTVAAEVATRVTTLLRKATDGTYLLPDEEDVVYFGLHALAAARHTAICQPFVAWLRRRSEADGEALLGNASDDVERQVLLSVFDGDVDALYGALEDRATDGGARWNLFVVLARLAWDGRIERERLVAFLDRFEREAMAPRDDWAWYGWQDAIMHLGLEQMRERVRQAWKGPLSELSDADREEWLEALDFTVTHPSDPKYFIDDLATPFSTPVQPLNRFTLNDLLDTQNPPARLGRREMQWLVGFLSSKHMPTQTMHLEMLDGYLCAIAAGPAKIPPLELVKPIWSIHPAEHPDWDSAEQESFFTTLVQRYIAAIIRDLNARRPVVPVLDHVPGTPHAWTWAMGFIVGINSRLDDWTKLIDDEDGSQILGAIAGLIAEKGGKRRPPTPRQREETIHEMPAAIAAIHAFWHDRTRFAHLIARGKRVGRNAACPCGSGRKFKRCCGSPDSVRH